MAFIIENDSVISFAEFTDVVARDQRLFDSNEGLTDDVVEPLLIRATERVLARIRATVWWRDYWIRNSSTGITTVGDIPNPNADLIAARHNDFTDLCVYVALADYILPMVADFGNADSAERNKMGYYSNRAEALLMELVTLGDWYDWNGDGVVESNEKDPGHINLKRVR